MGRKLTLRGNIVANTIVSLLDYEGVDLTRGWKVISGNALDQGNPSGTVRGIILHTDDQIKTTMDFNDNQVVGWIGGPPTAVDFVMDPNHVIVNSLYATGMADCTYLVVLEEVRVEPIQNVIYQLKERAQSSLEPHIPPV